MKRLFFLLNPLCLDSETLCCLQLFKDVNIYRLTFLLLSQQSNADLTQQLRDEQVIDSQS